MTDCLDFIDSYRSPPAYRCASAAAECTRPAPSEWTCGPFSMVRAMRKLGAMVRAAGLTKIAVLCATKSPGYVEASLNQERDGVSYTENPDRWFELDALRNAARNIRKWRVEP